MGYMARTYTGFFSHTIIYYGITIIVGVNPQPSNYFSIQFDDQAATTFKVATGLTADTKCNGVDTARSTIFGKVLHTGSSVIVRIRWNTHGSTGTDAFLGIKDVSLSFRPIKSDDVPGSYVTRAKVTTVSQATQCADGSYFKGPLCAPCPANCAICDDKDCLRPTFSYSYDSSGYYSCTNQCVYCYRDPVEQCYLCKPGYVRTINNQCLSINIGCPSPYIAFGATTAQACLLPCTSLQYMLYNGTCINSCPAPLVSSQIPQGKTCDYPCSLSADSFLYWNGSCLPTCPTYQRSENGFNFCDACQPGFYEYPNGSCHQTCYTSFRSTMIGGSKFCTYPCDQAEYLYENGTCLLTCTTPFIQRIEGTFMFCDFGCQGDLQYYYPDEGVCKATCGYPYRIARIVFCETALSLGEELETEVTVKTMNATGTALTVGAIMLGLFDSKDPTSFFLLALSRMFLSMRYMDIIYPPKLQKIFDNQRPDERSSKLLSQAKDRITAASTDYPIPENFARYRLHSSFLVNFWQSLVSILILLFIILIAYTIWLCTKKRQKFNQILTKLLNVFMWNFFLGYILSFYDRILLYSSLELRASSIDSATQMLSLIVVLLINMGIFFKIGTIFSLLYDLNRQTTAVSGLQRSQNLTAFSLKWHRCLVFYVTFRDTHMSQRAYFLLSNLRIYLFYIILVCTAISPLIQTILIMLMTTGMVIYLFVRYPIKDRVRMVQTLLQELIMLCVNVSILILAALDHVNTEARETREKLGEVIIYSVIAFSWVGITFMVISTLARTIMYLNKKKADPSVLEAHRHEGGVNLDLSRFDHSSAQNIRPQHFDNSSILENSRVNAKESHSGIQWLKARKENLEVVDMDPVSKSRLVAGADGEQFNKQTNAMVMEMIPVVDGLMDEKTKDHINGEDQSSLVPTRRRKIKRPERVNHS